MATDRFELNSQFLNTSFAEFEKFMYGWCLHELTDFQLVSDMH